MTPKCPSVNVNRKNADLIVPNMTIESLEGANLRLGQKARLRCFDGFVSKNNLGECNKERQVQCSKTSTSLEWYVEGGECLPGCLDNYDCQTGQVCQQCQCRPQICRNSVAAHGNINIYIDGLVGSKAVFTCQGS